MCDNRFYICEKCGNIVGMIHNGGVPMMCCGQKMAKLEQQKTQDSLEAASAAAEKPKPKMPDGRLKTSVLCKKSKKCPAKGKRCARVPATSHLSRNRKTFPVNNDRQT